MPIETDLSVAPHFDAYDANAKYYKVLTKPGIPLQNRELIELQDMLQVQVERFGDAIFKNGTIVQGCNFSFYPDYTYAKLKDADVSGVLVDPSQYVGLFAHGQTGGVRGVVVNSADGFESTDPDLKTIYVTYTNAGTDGNTAGFVGGETLQVTDDLGSVFSVEIANSSVGFSNTDQVVFTPAVAVNVSSGSFTNGEYVTFTGGANLQIVQIDANTLANSGQVILRVLPRSVDLANASLNSLSWSASLGAIRNAGNTAAGNVVTLLGSGARAVQVTDGAGRLSTVTVEDKGSGYLPWPPTATVRSINNASGIAGANLVAKNWLTNVVVSNVAGAVGTAYAVGVGPGVVYQKGYFLLFSGNTAVVQKYGNSPDGVALGFATEETVVTAAVDPNLNDNALGSPNYSAPGADRLKLDPGLVVANTTDVAGNSSFFPLVVWNEGQPSIQNQNTAYSGLGDALAVLTSESEGDFVVSKFDVVSRCAVNAAAEGNSFALTVSPGTAYVGGYRVQTRANYTIGVPKCMASLNSPSQSVTLGYGDWIRVKEVGGVFQFSTGDTVTFYDQAKGFLSNTSLVSTNNVAAVGNAVGTARIRSLVHETGTPGVAGTTYRMYLFNLSLNPGANFRQVKSVSYAGTYAGIADVVLELDGTTGTNVAVVHDQGFGGLLFSAGVDSLKNASNVAYTYRTIDQTLSFANTGILTKSIAGNPGETYVQAGVWTDAEASDLYVIPTGGSLRASSNMAGTGAGNTTQANLVGTSTTFGADVRAGDYLLVFQNSTVSDVRRVTSVVNNTLLTMDANLGFTGSGCAIYRYFPNAVAIPFGSRTGLTANADVTAKTLTLDLGMALNGSVSVNATVAVSINRSNVAAGTKTANRDKHVRLRLANNSDGATGPWSIGVPDALRLKGVWKGTNATFDATNGVDVTKEFYVDSNQTVDYLGLSYLYLRPRSALSLNSSTDYLLVKFDYMTGSGGYYDSVSYVGSTTNTASASDSSNLSSLGSSIASAEVPEVYDSRGNLYDLFGYFDFRPPATNTAAPASTAAGAPLNPTETVSFGNTADPTNDKKFPLPGSALTGDIEQWLSRWDSVFIGSDGNVFVLSGSPAPTGKAQKPNQPDKSMKVDDLIVPAWPSYAARWSNTVLEVYSTKMANEKLTNSRVQRRAIVPTDTQFQIAQQQPKRYTHRDVGELERRLRNVEYVVNLNELETDVVNRVIRSSIDPSQNRFKFGFFADDFSTYVSQDLQNPQYAARIFQGKQTPPVISWTLQHGLHVTPFLPVDPPAPSTPPYIDEVYIDQTAATWGPKVVAPVVAVPPPPPPPPDYTGVLTVDPPSMRTLIATSDWWGGADGGVTPVVPSGGGYGNVPIKGIVGDIGASGAFNDAGGSVDLYVFAADMAFKVISTGMRPNARHSFFVNGIDESARCAPFGGNIGDPLVSRSDGVLPFVWFFSYLTNLAVDHAIRDIIKPVFWSLNTIQDSQRLASQDVPFGNLTLAITQTSGDGSSRSRGAVSITSKYFNYQVFGTPWNELAGKPGVTLVT